MLNKVEDLPKNRRAGLGIQLNNDGILVLRPNGPLRRADFDRLSGIVDRWLNAHSHLTGVVISAGKFPGWKSLGAFLRHMEFVYGHHRKFSRIALAVDGMLPEIVSEVVPHFAGIEIKQFPFGHIEEASDWVKS